MDSQDKHPSSPTLWQHGHLSVLLSAHLRHCPLSADRFPLSSVHVAEDDGDDPRLF